MWDHELYSKGEQGEQLVYEDCLWQQNRACEFTQKVHGSWRHACLHSGSLGVLISSSTPDHCEPVLDRFIDLQSVADWAITPLCRTTINVV